MVADRWPGLKSIRHEWSLCKKLALARLPSYSGFPGVLFCLVAATRRSARRYDLLSLRFNRMESRSLMSDTSDKLAFDAEDAARLRQARDQIVIQLGKVIVGQNHVIDEILVCLFSQGHCLLEGVPGLAKTLMISTLARTLSICRSAGFSSRPT
jgi:hypothetical protein